MAPLQTTSNDFYWKVGIKLHDLDVAVTHLEQQGWSVSEPSQFLDIGYMSRLPDPDRNSVGNREWFWARPYALIEVQHLERPGTNLKWPETGESCFDALGFSDPLSDTITYVTLQDLAKTAASCP